MDSQSPVIRLPLDTDRSIFLWAYSNTGEIRIRFDGGGFIKHRLFKFICATAHTGVADDDSVEMIREDHDFLVMKYPRGRVTVTTTSTPLTGSMRMTIRIVLPGDGRVVEKQLSDETVKEIERRVRQIEALLETYLEEVGEEDDEPHERHNGVAHATAL